MEVDTRLYINIHIYHFRDITKASFIVKLFYENYFKLNIKTCPFD